MSNVNGSVIAGLLVAAFPVCQNVGDFCMKSGGHVPPDVPPFDTHNGRTKRKVVRDDTEAPRLLRVVRCVAQW